MQVRDRSQCYSQHLDNLAAGATFHLWSMPLLFMRETWSSVLYTHGKMATWAVLDRAAVSEGIFATSAVR